MSLTMAQAASISRGYYSSGSFVMRKIQHWRPYICPLDTLLDFVPPHSSVLDIGCGCGLFLALLAADNRCIEGVGFDSSAPAVATAVQMAEHVNKAQLGSTLNFQKLAIEEPWPSGEFDVVSMIDVLHHVPVPVQQSFFCRALSKVKAGGILIYKDLSTRPLWRVTANRLHDAVVARQIIHEIEVPLVCRWAAESGATVSYQQSTTRKWYGHEIVIFATPKES